MRLKDDRAIGGANWRALLCGAALLAGGGVYAADTVQVGSTNPGDSPTGVVLPVQVTNENAVVGVQFVMRYPDGYVDSGEPLVLSSSSDHEVVSTDDAEGVRRVVVLSRTNTAFPEDFELGLPLELGDGSPAGGPSVAVGEIVFTDAAGGVLASATEYTLAETWRRANFSESEREAGVLVGDDVDVDGDGVANLGELARGTDPRGADARGEGGVDVAVGGDGKVYLTVRFWRSSDPAVQAAVPRAGETSVDLAAWNTDGVTVVPTGATDASGEEVEARAEVGAGDLQRYLRVRTQRAEGE